MSALQENLSLLFRPAANRTLRTLILPLDHGIAIPVPGLADVANVITQTRPYYDSFVLNYGAARATASAWHGKALCLRTDVYKPHHQGNAPRDTVRVYGAAEAVQLGARSVMNMLYAHHPEEDRLYRETASLIAECHREGVPVILEALPFGLGRPQDYTPENIAFTVRLAAELGADVVKTAYPGDKAAFADIVRASFVPVIVLGGPPAADERGFLQTVRDALDAGAAGIAIGRNVWAHASPALMARRLHALVHEDASVDQALALTTA